MSVSNWLRIAPTISAWSAQSASTARSTAAASPGFFQRRDRGERALFERGDGGHVGLVHQLAGAFEFDHQPQLVGLAHKVEVHFHHLDAALRMHAQQAFAFEADDGVADPGDRALHARGELAQRQHLAGGEVAAQDAALDVGVRAFARGADGGFHCKGC